MRDHDGDPSSSKETSKKKEIDFLKDDPHEMTWGRRIALYMASRFSWYNPYLNQQQGNSKKKKKNTPSLAKAWAYFEHVTLERHHVNDDDNDDHDEQREGPNNGSETVKKSMRQRVVRKFHKGDRRLEIAEPGENQMPTKLYSPLSTPLSQMGDFGLGYGIYFSTLRSYAVLCLIAGLVNLPNLFYFASSAYNGGSDQGDAVSFMLKGSAICTGKTEYLRTPSIASLACESFKQSHLVFLQTCRGSLVQIAPTSTSIHPSLLPSGVTPLDST